MADTFHRKGQVVMKDKSGTVNRKREQLWIIGCCSWCAEALQWNEHDKYSPYNWKKKYEKGNTPLQHKEIGNAEEWTREWQHEFTGCTPTKESSIGHPAYPCCQHREAKEVQQKQWVQFHGYKQRRRGNKRSTELVLHYTQAVLHQNQHKAAHIGSLKVSSVETRQTEMTDAQVNNQITTFTFWRILQTIL